jgi:hypothetical protein
MRTAVIRGVPAPASCWRNQRRELLQSSEPEASSTSVPAWRPAYIVCRQGGGGRHLTSASADGQPKGLAKVAKRPSERSSEPERVPSAPAPLAASARDGMQVERDAARKLLSNCVDLLAGIVLGVS